MAGNSTVTEQAGQQAAEQNARQQVWATYYNQLLEEEKTAWEAFSNPNKPENKKGFFASSINFSVNGMKLSGHTGTVIKGGGMILFEGAYLDLTAARMRGVSKKEVAGEGGILVLTPKKTDNGNVLRIKTLNIREQGGITAETEDEFCFREVDSLKGRTVRGSGLKVSGNKIEIKRAMESTPYGTNTQLIQGGTISEQGIVPETAVETVVMTQLEKREQERREAEELEARKKLAASVALEAQAAVEAKREGTARKERMDNAEAERQQAVELARQEAENAEPIVEMSAEGVFLKIGRRRLEIGYNGEINAEDGYDPSNAISSVLGELDWKKCFENLSNFIRLGELPEEEKSKCMFTLAEIPLLPGLAFEIKGGYEAGLSFGVGLAAAKEERPLKDIEQWNVDLKGNLEGSLFAKLSAGFAAGLPGLFSITAAAGIKGGVEGTLLNGKASLSFVNNGAGFRLGPSLDITVDNKEGICFVGKAEGGLGVEIPLLAWEKDLVSYTFGEWKMDRPVLVIPEITITKDTTKPITKGWTVAKTKGSNIGGAVAEDMQKHSRENDRKDLGIDHTEEIRYKQTMAEAAEVLDAYEKAKEELMHLKDYQNVIIPEGSEGFQEFLGRLESIETKFKDLELRSYISFLNQDTVYGELLNDPRYLKALKSFEKREGKHNERLQGMETWAEKGSVGQKGGAPDQVTSPLEAYKKLGGGAGIDNTLMEKAKAEIYTLANIVAYEKQWIQNKCGKHILRIADLRGGWSAGTPAEGTAEELIKEIYGDMKLPGVEMKTPKSSRRIGKEKEQMLNTGEMTVLEKEFIDQAEAPYIAVREALRPILETIAETDRDKPNAAFLRQYMQLAESRGILNEKDLAVFAGGAAMEAYERERLLKKAGRKKKDLAVHLMGLEAARESGMENPQANSLADFLAAVDIPEGQRAAVSAQRNALLQEAKQAENSMQRRSIDDVISYEESRRPDLDSASAAMRSQLSLAPAARDRAFVKEMRRHQKELVARMRSDAAGMAEMVSIQEMIAYENGRARHYEQARQNLPPDAPENLRYEYEQLQKKHQERLDILSGHAAFLDKFEPIDPSQTDPQKVQEQEEKRKAAEKRIVEHYLSSPVSGGGFLNALGNGDMIIPSVVLGNVSWEWEQNKDSWGNRMELLQRAKKEGTPMERVQAAYENAQGRYFKESVEKQSVQNVTLEQLRAYMESKLGEGEKRHLERYRYIRQWQREDMSGQELADRYRNQELLGGGTMNGSDLFIKDQIGKKHGNITPMGIMDMLDAQRQRTVPEHREMHDFLMTWQAAEAKGEMDSHMVSSRYAMKLNLKGYSKTKEEVTGKLNQKYPDASLTPEQKVTYEINRMYQLSEKHMERLFKLRGAGTDQEKVEQYFDEGGDGFEAAMKKRVEEEFKRSSAMLESGENLPLTPEGRRADERYQLIVEHEQSRLEKYKQDRGDSIGIIGDLTQKWSDLTKQKEEGKEVLAAVQKARNSLGQGGADVRTVVDELLAAIEGRIEQTPATLQI